MKVIDLFCGRTNPYTRDLSIDVCDDYDERCYIAFESGYRLTKAGAERFKDALGIEVIPHEGFTWTLHCENGKEAQACKELFESFAGLCAYSDFDKWFQEV
jgi:hypothetical protein